MGDVVQQLLLGLHQQLELVGHAVAVFGQVDDFITALAHHRPHPGFEAAQRNVAHRPPQISQRPRQVVGHVPTEQRAHQRADDQRDPVAQAPGFVGRMGRPEGQRGPVLADQRLFISHLRDRRAGQQLTGTVINANGLAVGWLPHRQELAARLDTVLFQQLFFAGQDRIQMVIPRAKAARHENAQPHQERQAGGQPKGQEQFPEQPAGFHHSAINR